MMKTNDSREEYLFQVVSLMLRYKLKFNTNSSACHIPTERLYGSTRTRGSGKSAPVNQQAMSTVNFYDVVDGRVNNVFYLLPRWLITLGTAKADGSIHHCIE